MHVTIAGPLIPERFSMEVEIANYLNQVSEGRLSSESKLQIREMLREVTEIESIGDREQVYENIRTAVSLNQLNSKVEPGDPKLLREDKEALLRHYIDYRTAYGFCVKKYIAEDRKSVV